MRWDQARADWLVGKHVLVGVTYVAPDGETVEAQEQYHGRIVVADRRIGMTLEGAGSRSGEMIQLPPDTSVFGPGSENDYRLRSTGEVVSNPDAIATWTVFAPPEA